MLEGAGVVVPMGGVVRFVCLDGMVGLERVVLGLVVVVVAACGVVWAAGVACGAGVGLEPLFGGVTFGGVAVGGVMVTGLTGGLETVLGAATVTGFKPRFVLWAVWGVSRAS